MPCTGHGLAAAVVVPRYSSVVFVSCAGYSADVPAGTGLAGRQQPGSGTGINA